MEYKFKKIELVSLFILLSVYLILATKDISLPGVNSDEAFNATGTINLIKNKDTFYMTPPLNLFGRDFPLMINQYHGGLGAYLLIPFFFLFGVNVFSLRIASISFGLLTLIFTYLLAKKFFSRQVAFIAIFLLVTSPYFIFATKVGNYISSYGIFFSTTALFCFLKWYKGRSIGYFFLGIFLLGLGSSVLGWFIVVIISFLILAFIFRKDIKKRIQNGRFKSAWFYVILGILLFCVGDFLVLYANFIHTPSKFYTLKWVFSHFRNTTLGVNNLEYIKNFISRIENLVQVLKESDAMRRASLEVKDANNFYPFIFFLLLLYLAVALFFRKDMFFKKKKVILLLALVCSMFIVSPFTVSNYSSWHLFILVPFIQLIVSVGLIEFIHFFKNRILQRVSWGIVFLILIFSTGINLRILSDCYLDMKNTGGRTSWSDAIYELANWLKENKPSNIIATHWVFCRNLYFLMQGEKYVYDLSEDKHIEDYTELFKDENNIYLVNVQLSNSSFAEETSEKVFRKAVDMTGKKLIEEKIFYQRNGEQVYIAYSVK